MIKAVIDIGTNSIKCVIAEVEEGLMTILRDINRVTRLGAELASNGSIGTEAMQRNIHALKEIQDICTDLQVENAVCVGAETLRKAKDTDIFKEMVWQELGWRVRALSSDEEAQLSYQASAWMAPPGVTTLVIDSGGGSTEITLGKDGVIASQNSLPLGAVVLTKKFVHSDPVNNNDYAAMRQYIQEQIKQQFPIPEAVFTIACGGGLTSMAAVGMSLALYDPYKVHGYTLTKSELERQLQLYIKCSLEERKKIIGLPPDRADIIIAGAAIVLEIMRHFGLDEVKVSTYGLRHALLT